MKYDHRHIEFAREFMQSDNGSYSRLADHLNKFAPRQDGLRWTKDSSYHLCRTNGIASKRRCSSQPAAGLTKRARTRNHVITATIDALAVFRMTVRDIAPVQIKQIASLSGVPISSIRNNWSDLQDTLNEMAGIPRPIRYIED